MSKAVQLKSSLKDYFGEIIDPRVSGRCRHRLLDIIAIALLAVLAGADGWKGIETYGKAKKDWLSTFLELPNDIPSHDTFSRVLARLERENLEKSFRRWSGGIVGQLGAEVVAIDGKTVRGS